MSPPSFPTLPQKNWKSIQLVVGPVRSYFPSPCQKHLLRIFFLPGPFLKLERTSIPGRTKAYRFVLKVHVLNATLDSEMLPAHTPTYFLTLAYPYPLPGIFYFSGPSSFPPLKLSRGTCLRNSLLNLFDPTPPDLFLVPGHFHLSIPLPAHPKKIECFAPLALRRPK